MASKVLISWSSGKDSAWMLNMLLRDPEYEVVGLLTTVNAVTNRVEIHSTPLTIVEAQARAAGLPLQSLPLPWPCSNEAYEKAIFKIIDEARKNGVTHIAFGDLFLEDIREYRVRLFNGTGIEPLFPLWHEPTTTLAHRIIEAGVQAVVTSVHSKKLSQDFVGKKYDKQFLDDLPSIVDPCGENGEFHTCVLAGPMFHESLNVDIGEIEKRDEYYQANLRLSGDNY